MKSFNDRVLVRVNVAQKNAMMIGNVLLTTALKYETNYREKSPVIAKVVDATDRLNEGDFLLCHHNHFGENSPYHLQEDLYSIPANHTIFAVLKSDGELSPVYGNVLASKVWEKTLLPVAPQYRTYYKDRGLVLDGGWTEFHPGDLIFTRPSAIYEIVYIFGDVQHRVCKINSTQICAVIAAPKPSL